MAGHNKNFVGEEIANVVVKREFTTADGSIVTLKIGQPVADGQDYYCPWQIIGLGETKIRKAYGVDSMQALVLALERIHIYITTSKGPQLFWFDNQNLSLLPRDHS